MPTLNWIGKDAVVTYYKEALFRLLEPVDKLSVMPERSDWNAVLAKLVWDFQEHSSSSR